MRLYIIFYGVMLILGSCITQKEVNKVTGTIEFSVSLGSQLLGSGSSAVEKEMERKENVSAIMISVDDSLGKNILKRLELPVKEINGIYITDPVSLIAGTYHFTEFFILNQHGGVIYAATKQIKQDDALRQNPLALNFVVGGALSRMKLQ